MPIPRMTNELVEQLGFIFSLDDENIPSHLNMTFNEFLERVASKGLSEERILANAVRLERLATYYNHQVKDIWSFSFDHFLKMVDTGAWEARFTA